MTRASLPIPSPGNGQGSRSHNPRQYAQFLSQIQPDRLTPLRSISSSEPSWFHTPLWPHRMAWWRRSDRPHVHQGRLYANSRPDRDRSRQQAGCQCLIHGASSLSPASACGMAGRTSWCDGDTNCDDGCDVLGCIMSQAEQTYASIIPHHVNRKVTKLCQKC
jgi:hypothetical protein